MLSYLRGLGLEVPEANAPTQFTLSFAGECHETACSDHKECHGIASKDTESTKPNEGVLQFNQTFEEALKSALTKFDSLEAYFSSGMAVPAVCSMLAEEMLQDKDYCHTLAANMDEFQRELRKAVGIANGAWKRNGGSAERKTTTKFKDNPLPWTSIDAYPEYVVKQIENYADAAPEEQVEARAKLEFALLERPLCAASIKYDGTCFGKLDTGELVGRRQVLGRDCHEYLKTSTAAAKPCDVAALRCALSKMLGEELGTVCVWGELMCNPGFYEYKERGLVAKWLCFGVVAALDGAVDDSSGCSADRLREVSRRLARQELAHSLSAGGRLRLLLCPALRRLLAEEAGCDVVDEQFPGATHAEVVSQAAASLSSGANEGLVMVFARPDGEASLRKWKNSAEGGSVSKKHAHLLQRCQGLCDSLVSEDKLDVRIAEMVQTMRRVAEAETSPPKKGRSKV